MPLRCEIITQERKLFDEAVDMVMAPGIEGVLGILPQHQPLITALSFGELRLKTDGEEHSFAIGGGVLQVANDHVIVLADSAEQADEIDETRAEEARRRAEKMMVEGPPPDPAEMAALEAAIKRAELRLKVARRKPRRGSGPSGMTFE